MNRTLILVRHAHRDKDLGHSVDNGLSEKGWRQAKAIAEWLEGHVESLGEKPLLVSSPKKRCLETLEPFAKKTKLKIDVREIVNEGPRLLERTEEFYKWWVREAPSLVVVCSHGDLLPELVHLMTGARIELKKGAVVEISGPSTAPFLVNLIQRP